MGTGRGIQLPLWILILAATCIQKNAHAQNNQPLTPDTDYSDEYASGQDEDDIGESYNLISSGSVKQKSRPLITAHNDQVCSTWGNFHYKTFDGNVYHFSGTCNYLFASNCKSDYEDFNIQIRRTVVKDIPTFSHIILKIHGEVIEFVGSKVIINNEEADLPYSHSGIQIDHNGLYMRLHAKIGLELMWNEEDALMLELDGKFANSTCGLCGDFNDSPKNEFLSNGVEMTPMQFGNLQKVNGPTEECDDIITEPQDSCSDDSSTCEAILTGPAFSECNSAVNVAPYIEACEQDLCRCNNESHSFCLCNTFAEYSRQCGHSGSKPQNWRKPDLCQITCPFNMQYEECGVSCVDTCSNNEQSALCDNHCTDGCYCPAGTVYDDITHTGCIKQTECPCTFNQKTYEVGTGYETNCHACTCEAGSWDCDDLPCVETCSVEGGSHIRTFDGTHYNFHGDCSYVLAKHCTENTFNIMAELRMCGKTESETCLKSVTISLNGGDKTFFIKPCGTVLMDMVTTPLPIYTDGISVFQPSSTFMIVNTPLGVQIEIELTPIMQIRMRLEPHLEGKTCGLCGNFNKNQADDFKTQSGVVEGTGASFANNWKTQSDCPNVKNIHEDPCAGSIENEKYAEHWCEMISDPSGPFAPCHALLDPTVYEENCMFDTCNNEKTEDSMCAAVSAYVRACAFNGVILDGWRSEICGKYSEDCPETQSYTYSTDTCQATCRSLSENDATCGVKFIAVDGCVCPKDTYKDENGECLKTAECSCYYKGSFLAHGEVVHEYKGICTCSQGKVNCIGVQPTEPDCMAPMVYFDCANVSATSKGSECQKSCQTFDVECYSSYCVSGCICPQGMVLDGKGDCIKEEACPCVHNEVEYQPGEEISVSCNTCTCKDRKWQCTNKPCFGTCSVYGDGHYITFDSKRYSFNGDCQYTLAQDYCGNSNPGTFRVIIENIPCGTTGTTCSKSIRLFMGGYELILHEAHIDVVERDNSLEVPYKVRSMGIYTVIESTHGVVLLWDKKTSIFIKLSSAFKSNVCGLCGNFDSNGMNDFTTRSQAVVGDVLEFGNSWKAAPTCPDALEPKDACSTNPYRKAWAQKQCSIIKSDAFSTCHSQVDPSKFYDACVTDACACDTGGDCECFCTAVAAYAQACSEAGVCIHWRTPTVCPLFCDFYNADGDCEWHYKSCGVPCMKTCTNPSGKCLYDLPGLEGCYPSCPEDRPYFDEENMACTASCGCYDEEGNLFRPGDEVYTDDNCIACTCVNNKFNCKYDLEACFCEYDGQKYKYNEVIYRTGDNLGGCFVATCEANGTIHREITPCSTSSPPTTILTFTTTVPTSSVTTASVPTTVCVHEVCTWTDWMDHSYPTPGPNGGDYETLELMEENGETVCKTPRAIQCRAAKFPEATLEDIGQVVKCDPKVGLICNNKDQSPAPICNNYQVRFECCSFVTCGSTTPSTTEPITSIVTETTSVTTKGTPETSTETSTTVTSTTGETTTPSTTEETTTSRETPTSKPEPTTSVTVTVTETTTTKETSPSTTGHSTVPISTTPSTTEVIETSTTTLTTPKPTTTEVTTTIEPTITSSTTTVTEPTSPGVTSCEPKCQWSAWFDDDTPSSELNDGDHETFDNIIASGKTICEKSEKISRIECRAEDEPNTDIAELGQNVHCDMKYGLVCNNADQVDNDNMKTCHNYQMRVLCCDSSHCTTPVSTEQTTTATTATETTAPSTSAVTETITTTGSTSIPSITTGTEPTTTGESTTQIVTETPTSTSTTESTTVTETTTPATTTGTETITTTGSTSLPSTTTGTESTTTTGSSDAPSTTTGTEPTTKETTTVTESTTPATTTGTETITTTGSTSIPSTTTGTEPTTATGSTSAPSTTTGTEPTTTESTTVTESTTPATTTGTEPITTTGSTSIPSTTTGTEPATTTVSTAHIVSKTTALPVTTSETTTVLEPTTTSSTTTVTEPTSPGVTSCEPKCQWSSWFDDDTPTSELNDGDHETFENIIASGKTICEKSEKISHIECRAEDDPNTDIAELGQNVHCDMKYGLVCNNADQADNDNMKTCHNYQMRVLCCDSSHCTTPVTTEQTTTATSATETTAPSTSAVTETITTTGSTSIPSTATGTEPTTTGESTTQIVTETPTSTSTTESTTVTETTTPATTTGTETITTTGSTSIPSTTTGTESTTTTGSTAAPSTTTGTEPTITESTTVTESTTPSTTTGTEPITTTGTTSIPTTTTGTEPTTPTESTAVLSTTTTTGPTTTESTTVTESTTPATTTGTEPITITGTTSIPSTTTGTEPTTTTGRTAAPSTTSSTKPTTTESTTITESTTPATTTGTEPITTTGSTSIPSTTTGTEPTTTGESTTQIVTETPTSTSTTESTTVTETTTPATTTGTETITTTGSTSIPSTTTGTEPTTTTRSTAAPSTTTGTEPTTTESTTVTESTTPATTTGTESITTTGSTKIPSTTTGTESTTTTGSTAAPSTTTGTEPTTTESTTVTESTTPATTTGTEPVTTTGSTSIPSTTTGTESTTTTGSTAAPSTTTGTEPTTTESTTVTESTTPATTTGTEPITTTGSTSIPSTTTGTKPTTTGESTTQIITETPTSTSTTESTTVTETTTPATTTGTEPVTTTGSTSIPSTTTGTEPTTTTRSTAAPSTTTGTEPTTTESTTVTESTTPATTTGTESITTTGSTSIPSTTTGTESTTTTGSTAAPSTTTGTEPTTTESTTVTESTTPATTTGTEPITTTGSTSIPSTTTDTEPTTTTGSTAAPSTTTGTEPTTTESTTVTESTTAATTTGTEPITTTGSTSIPSTTTGTESTTTTGSTAAPSTTTGTEPTTTESTTVTESTTPATTSGTETITTTGSTSIPSTTTGTEPTTTTGSTAAPSKTTGTEPTTTESTTVTESTTPATTTGTEPITTTGSTSIPTTTTGTEPTTPTGSTAAPSTTTGTEPTTTESTTVTESTTPATTTGTEPSTTTGTTSIPSTTTDTEPTTTTGRTAAPSTTSSTEPTTTESTTVTESTTPATTAGTEPITTTGSPSIPSTTTGTEPATTTVSTTQVVSKTTALPVTTSETTTVTESTTTSSTTTVTEPTSPGVTSCEPKCQWSPWFDDDTPTSELNDGDHETFENIIASGKTICEKSEKISSIECRAEDDPNTDIAELGQNVHCDMKYGLVCNNADQADNDNMKTCHNYQMRVLCCDSSHCTTPVTTEQTTTATTATETTAPSTSAVTETITTTGSTSIPSTTTGTEPTTTSESTTQVVTETTTISPPTSETTTVTETTTLTTTAGTEPTTTTGTISTETPTVTTATGTETTSEQTTSAPTVEVTTPIPVTETTSITETTTPSTTTSIETTTSVVTSEISTPGTSTIPPNTSTTTSTTGESSTSTSAVITTKCFCNVNGTHFRPGEILYNVTDKTGCEFYAICSDSCQAVQHQGPCTTSPSPGTTIPSTSEITTVTTAPTSPTENTTPTTPPTTSKRPGSTTTPGSEVLPTTVHLPTLTIPDGCYQVDPPREVGDTWEITRCSNATCEEGGNVTINHIECPAVVEVTCESGLAPIEVYNQNGCCFHYECESCVGPDGNPKMPGDTWTSNCQQCSCDKEKITVECVPMICKELTPPPCNEEGYELVEEIVPDNPCCTKMACKCNPRLCIPDVMKCDIGFRLNSIISEGDCCAKMECVPEKVCVYNNITYQPDSNIPQTKESCEKCECTEEIDPTTQLYSVACEKIACKTECSQGYEYTMIEGECCGECVQKACLVKTEDDETKVLEVGESWSPTGSNCTYYECDIIDDKYISVTVRRSCPELEDCAEESIVMTSDGCCKTCKPTPQTKESCKTETKPTVLAHGGCNTTVEQSVCEGLCSSSSSFSYLSDVMEHKCSCCQELKTSRKEAELTCADGSIIGFSYLSVEECGCVGTVCVPQDESDEDIKEPQQETKGTKGTKERRRR